VHRKRGEGLQLTPSQGTAADQGTPDLVALAEGLACYLSRVVVRRDRSNEKERCRKIDGTIAQHPIGRSIERSAVLLTGRLGCHRPSYQGYGCSSHLGLELS